LPGTALVIADLAWADGSPVAVSPRAVLRRQLDRLAQRGLVADVATELEFIVFDQSYRQAWAGGYRDLTPASDYNIDYAIMASSRMEPLLRDIRLGMQGAGLRVEAIKGECNNGQQEIGFRYDEALVTCDNHAIYKNGAKEIADQHGKSLTFMAKYDEREGNSCHVHLSLRGSARPCADQEYRPISGACGRRRPPRPPRGRTAQGWKVPGRRCSWSEPCRNSSRWSRQRNRFRDRPKPARTTGRSRWQPRQRTPASTL